MSYTTLTGGVIVCDNCGGTSFHLNQTEAERKEEKAGAPLVFHSLCMDCGKEGRLIEFRDTPEAGTDDPAE
jgi:hypothetical protein